MSECYNAFMPSEPDKTNDDKIMELLREIRDDQRQALERTRAIFPVLKYVAWALVGVVLLAGVGICAVIVSGILRISSSQ